MITRPKGTQDIFGEQTREWVALEQKIRNIARLYNYSEIRTPIFEKSSVFHRDVNDTTDIVTKETYDFLDRGKRGMTLRPEGTAGAIRAYIENKMYASGGVSKLFYIGPLFRYERPQAGRQRQFHQFGIEALNSDSPYLDAEVINVGIAFIKSIGFGGIKVRINSLGDEESRNNYRKALVSYFKTYEDDLCSDCKVRLEKNPLRILDCKIDSGKEYFKNAPKISDYLNEESKKHFKTVLQSLDLTKTEYVVDDNLVRGLDYYTHTVFEITAEIEGFGAQNVICGGGRYNKLVEDLGGPSIPAVGLAFGLERILLALKAENVKLVKEKEIHAYIITLGERAHLTASKLTNALRYCGLIVETDYQNRGLKSQFKQADKLNSLFTCILGDSELDNGTINVKNNVTKEQVSMPMCEVKGYLQKNIKHIYKERK